MDLESRTRSHRVHRHRTRRQTWSRKYSNYEKMTKVNARAVVATGEEDDAPLKENCQKAGHQAAAAEPGFESWQASPDIISFEHLETRQLMRPPVSRSLAGLLRQIHECLDLLFLWC